MFISVKHSISNPQEFWEIAKESLPNLPQGIKMHSSYPTADMATAFCLWEAGSLDEFKKYLEGVVGHVSKNDYYPVEEKFAIGLPK
ncbi:MAG TPA: hypothetical protein VLN45_05840 [Ignavibacteriaceae bacterium]|nr:hypothetical protein [Ignavibacteriaceae bacterium]